MLKIVIILLAIALVAWLLGAQGIAGLTMDIAWIVIIVFVVLAAIALIFGKSIIAA